MTRNSPVRLRLRPTPERLAQHKPCDPFLLAEFSVGSRGYLVRFAGRIGLAFGQFERGGLDVDKFFPAAFGAG
ncbi:MAG: hypothetical protein NZ899_05565 [Thermoguttaceae bacterium]|nr:hypothetical protein [Thermoguttaceae bacterium]MDW8079408.1 hypothetical protein [Thermoguttaceae bacterium]